MLICIDEGTDNKINMDMEDVRRFKNIREIYFNYKSWKAIHS